MMTFDHQRDPRIENALRVVENLQRKALEDGPLSRMSEWVSAGTAPGAAELRLAGLTENGPEDPLQRHELSLSRKPFAKRWGFSIPCSEAVAALLRLGPILEIGSGTGYWSALLRAAGHDAIATDAMHENWGDHGYAPEKAWPVECLTAQAAVRKYAERDVFCSWPTDGDSWALAAAWAMRPGCKLAAILTPDNTGTNGLRRYLNTRFQKLETIVLPQFPGCADDLTIYQKL